MTLNTARLPALALLGWLMFRPCAHAHNPPVHRDLVAFAYELARLVERLPMQELPEPMGANADEWRAYLNAIRATRESLRALNSDLSALDSLSCTFSSQPGDWAANRPLKDIPYPVRLDYPAAVECGIDTPWVLQGIYATPAEPPDYTGNVLGYWAAAIDLHEDDTHLFPSRANMRGLSEVFAVADELANLGIALPLIPFACLIDCIFGDCEDCYKGAFDVAEGMNPADVIINLVDVSNPDTVGVWHFMQMQPGAKDIYDDVPGQAQEFSGPEGMPDTFTMFMIAATDLVGATLSYEDSLGPKRYQIADGNDSHRDTLMRDAEGWQLMPMAHTTFEPIDNLAKYGWDRHLESSSSSEQLGYALHALGDVTVPMHVVGSTGWGHRAFEDGVHAVWPQYLGQSDDASHQLAQARRMLERGFHWYKYIRDWRTSHDAPATEVPVRDLVTQLAFETNIYARTQMSTGWPYDAGSSWDYQFGDERKAVDAYATPQRIDQTRPLIENGIGAILTFLVTAMGN